MASSVHTSKVKKPEHHATKVAMKQEQRKPLKVLPQPPQSSTRTISIAGGFNSVLHDFSLQSLRGWFKIYCKIPFFVILLFCKKIFWVETTLWVSWLIYPSTPSHFASLGADVIELGVPFSDPMADGSAIEAASVVAIKNGNWLCTVIFFQVNGCELIACFLCDTCHIDLGFQLKSSKPTKR